MRRVLLVLTMVIGLTPALTGCMSDKQETSPPPATEQTPSAQSADSAAPPPTEEQQEQPAGQAEQTDQTEQQQPSKQPDQSTGQPAASAEKVYQNDIFQDVTVQKTGENSYIVKGKARIFEAVVDYVVEDGHNELAEGSIQASKGAPDWGDFTIELTVKKDQPNSTLMLILFETSAKDGGRLHELAIALPQ